jgi:Domain of unknown function (DUF4382)/Domain of unknown function (DUF5666)
MHSKTLQRAVGAVLLASLGACGGGGSTGNAPPLVAPQMVATPVIVSDASAEDWAMIGVKVLSITLTPQGGGSAVTVYSAPAPVPVTNLAALDNIGELLASASIPAGTYTGASLTIAANPGDVVLTTAADPEAGFAAPAQTTIPSGQIQIQGAQGANGSQTVDVTVKLSSPLVVSSTQTSALDLEFDLGHPAFIIGHTPPGNGTTLWAVNFDGPVRHHRIDDITRLVLRHAYGTVASVSSDNSSILISKDMAAVPIQTPETAVSTGQSISVLADSANGTLFYDVDAKTAVTIRDFAAEAPNLSGKYVRIAARYQQNGTLVATRIWASASFSSVWLSPEGHVLHVDPANQLIVVSNEQGRPVALSVDANTEFFFRTPSSATADATPIGTGPSFLAAQNLVRGFKVHVSVIDPLAAKLVAQTVDIETATFDGRISNADAIGFTYTRRFATATDGYSVTLPYIASSSANGKDASGNAITGFKYWDFAYPTLATTGSNAVGDFIAATGGGIGFGGTFGSVSAFGASFARWGDAANPAGWSVPWTVLAPTPLPRGTVVAGLANNSFMMSVPGGVNAATVEVSTTTGAATIVYQVDRTNGVVTVSPEDITTSAGLAALTSGLAVGAPVKVYGVPQADGTLKAYVLTYFTGMMPTG